MALAILFFRQEGTLHFFDPDSQATRRRRFVLGKRSLSLKALFWAAVSIRVGLITRQLSWSVLPAAFIKPFISDMVFC
jgi:hypothetical protein